MPQRFLKPGITTSLKWNACSWMAQSFYIRILTLVDDYGRYEAHPRLLRSLAFPLSEDLRTDQVLALMQELQEQQLAHFYKAGGKEYLQLTGWSERVRAEKSRYPELDNTCCQMLSTAAESCEILPPSPPPSPTPSPVHTHNAREAEVPSLESVQAAVMTTGIPPEFVRMVYDSWSMRGGVDGNNVPVKIVPYVKKRWGSNEGVQWRAGTHKEQQSGAAGHATHRDDRRSREYAQDAQITAKRLT